MTCFPENNGIISHYFPKDLGKLEWVVGFYTRIENHALCGKVEQKELQNSVFYKGLWRIWATERKKRTQNPTSWVILPCEK